MCIRSVREAVPQPAKDREEFVVVSASTDGRLADTLPQDGPALAQALELSLADEAPPSSVPGYHIVRRLGAGRFGSVWLAREQNTGKLVAIKFYSRRRGLDWSLLGREVEKLAVLYTSRHIVRLLAVGWDHDPPYYVMEYLASGSLAQKLEQGPLPVHQAVAIATRVAQALVHAHGSGILHCDLKPANVLLDPDGEPRLCDFGQSRLADERSHALGTLFYMAPEQADLKAVPDARWDVYALGALLYHMLCGQPPHKTDDNEQALRLPGTVEERLARYQEIVRQGPRPSAHRRVHGVDGPLADLIDRCLSVDPARRLPNAQAVLDRLVARERYRARRPLIWLGLVLPTALVLALIPFALDALHAAVSTTRSNLIRRALESDVLSANLLADGIERELQHRIQQLEALTEDDEIRAAIREFAAEPLERRGPLFELLDARVQRIEKRLEELHRLDDASWFLQDARGVQRWRSPMSETVDELFNFRDYFHGQAADYPEGQVPADIAPIRRPHLSRPYRSRSSNRYVVALSAPVFDRPADKAASMREVIAVLARSFYLSRLLQDYEDSLRAQGNAEGRKLALLDRRTWSLLAHQWMDDEHLERLDDPVHQLRIDEALIARLAGPSTAGRQPAAPAGQAVPPRLHVDRVDNYRDPVAAFAPREYGGEWLAAFSPIGDTGWIAIVQEPKAPVLRPVEELRERLVRTAAAGIALVTLLVGGSWWMILSRLSDVRPRWWPRRPQAFRTDATLTG
jgi:hypothetical protein